jgi:hypothetical protein
MSGSRTIGTTSLNGSNGVFGSPMIGCNRLVVRLPIMIVWPSAFARTSSVIATMPLPPGLFSTTTGRLRVSVKRSLSTRAAMSLAPPAP